MTSAHDPQDDDDLKRHLGKKKELHLQPLSEQAQAPADEDLAAITARVNELAETASEQAARQQALVLPPQQAVPPVPAEAPRPHPPHADAALNIVRGKLARLYEQEPDADEEAIEAYQAGTHRSKHQQYMYDLTTSGKSLADIQIEWHKYYAGLPDLEKHEVWQEFYAAHAAGTAHAPQAKPAVHEKVIGARWKEPQKNDPRTVADIKHQVMRRAMPHGVKLKAKHHIQSLLFGVGMASLVLLIMLFGFFNERFLVPFMSPAREVSATPIVGTAGDIGPDQIIIIPKINLEVPVVYGTDSTNEQAIQDSLQDGVVHYSTSAMPGETGNVVIVGHSSNNILNKGTYKFAFVLLKRLEIGDTFSLNKGGKRYTYQIYDKKIVKPTDVSVLGPGAKPNSATLITCDPPGTSINRLVVVGTQISPDPAANAAVETRTPTLTSEGILPGNSPSLWQRIKNWF
jgi:sortase A